MAEVTTSSGVPMPGPGDLPSGPLRTLTEALHGLYEASGRPGLRRISAAVNNGGFRDTVSHEKVGAMLRGEGVPKWSKLEPVVIVLARWSTPRRDPKDETRRLKRLWDEAVQPQTQDRPDNVETGARLRSIFVLGGVTGETEFPDFERTELEQFCQRLGTTIAQAGVDLVICSPFPDAADFHALRGYVETGGTGTVHMHRPHHPNVENAYSQLSAVLGVEGISQVRNWTYPGPEKPDPESMGQAWLLCQLMAMEQADVVIAVGGKPDRTASTILHLAEARRKPVVPFAFLGGAAQRAYARRDWGHVYPWLDATSLVDKHAVREAVEIAGRMMLTQVGGTGAPIDRLNTVFISRARVDAEYSRALDQYLTTTGFDVLFGERELPPDRTVQAAIEDAVLRSDLFIVLWSRSYAASRYCFDEIDLALKRHNAGALRLWIINLDGSDVVPPGARHLPQLVARTPDAVVNIVRDLLAETD